MVNPVRSILHSKCTNYACGSNKLIYDAENAELVCSKCGQVIQTRIFEMENTAKRSTEVPESVSQTAYSRVNKGFTGVMSNTDSHGNKIAVNQSNAFKRMKRLNNSSRGRSMGEVPPSVIILLQNLTKKMNIPSIVYERTVNIYAKSMKAGLTRGRTRNSMLCAALYMACREYGAPHTITEILRHVTVHRRELVRCVRVLTMDLGITAPRHSPMKILSKMCNKIHMPEKVKRKAFTVMNRIPENKFSGKNPSFICGAIIFLCMENHGFNVKIKDLAKLSDTSDVTIRANIKWLFENKIVSKTAKHNKG